MAVKWTEEQKNAIELPSGKGNILVSAAAGSGKTAVLVERIFNIIAKEKIGIDKFLVVTFTNAAAAGMKEKIEERFKSEIEKCSSDEAEFWRKQIRLIDMASINTIDSFCINVLKNNYHNIGVDANFKIMDKASEELYCEKVLMELFDDLYNEEDDGFLKLVQWFSSFKSDDDLETIIKELHNKMSLYDDVGAFKNKTLDMYNPDFKFMEQLIIKTIIKPNLYDAKKMAHNCLNDMIKGIIGVDADFFESPNMRAELEKDYSVITGALEYIYKLYDTIKDLDTIDQIERYYDADIKIPDLRGKYTKIEYFPDYQPKAKQIYNLVAGIMNTYSKEALYTNLDSERIAELKSVVEELFRITQMFSDELMEIKNKRSSYSFNDIERMVYNLFKTNLDIRKEYTDKYYEILIDEYQDTNGLQDAIFEIISKDNIFVVGDLKQSIYMFRGGDPFIFKTKNEKYSDVGNTGTKIDLSKNFRSRSEVIDSVNDIFDAIMTDKNGDVDYSGKERLVTGMETEADDFYKSELHIIKSEKEDSDDQLEAEHIAKCINKLIGKEIYDNKNKVIKTIDYSDFCILLRSTKNVAPVYNKVFEKNKIPLVVELNDYFDNTEITVMIAVINTIDNVRQDVPLVTALRSALFNFSDLDLVNIKLDFGKDKKYLYEEILECSKSDNKLSRKCKRVITLLNKWRDYMKQHGVASLIWNIYEETGFYDCVAVAGGEKAQANLRLLYERAKQYEENGFKGLFSFVKYLDNLRTKDEVAGARPLQTNSVRLMTMHKSKGLEFPIVFVGGVCRNLNFTENIGKINLHKDVGLGIQYYDVENETYIETPYHNIISKKNKREKLSECLRLLYVAMTRAQYKLIVVGADELKDEKTEKNSEDKIRVSIPQGWDLELVDGKISENKVSDIKKYSDVIVPVMLKSKFWNVEFYNISHNDDECTDQSKIKLDYDIEALRENVYSLLDYEYPYQKSTVIPSRTTATEIKTLHNKKQWFAHSISKPAFMSDKKNAARRGTAYHNAVQHINLDIIKSSLDEKIVEEELKRLSDFGYVDAEYLDDKTADKIIKLFDSKLGKRILNAKQVYRERNFQLLVDSDVYDSSIPKDQTEKMILQGVIDCFFIEENGNVVLVDYKTDKVVNGDTSKAVENYTLQLELYSKAIQDIMQIEVNEKYLYLFDINKAIKI